MENVTKTANPPTSQNIILKSPPNDRIEKTISNLKNVKELKLY